MLALLLRLKTVAARAPEVNRRHTDRAQIAWSDRAQIGDAADRARQHEMAEITREGGATRCSTCGVHSKAALGRACCPGKDAAQRSVPCLLPASVTLLEACERSLPRVQRREDGHRPRAAPRAEWAEPVTWVGGADMPLSWRWRLLLPLGEQPGGASTLAR